MFGVWSVRKQLQLNITWGVHSKLKHSGSGDQHDDTERCIPVRIELFGPGSPRLARRRSTATYLDCPLSARTVE